MEFANLEVQSVLQNATFSIKLEGQKGQISKCCMHATLKIMLPTEGGEHIFKTTSNNKEKRVYRAIKRQSKQQMAHEMHTQGGP